MGPAIIVAAYLVYAAFWIRFFMHFLAWQEAAQRLKSPRPITGRSSVKACAQTVVDVVLFGRLLNVNPGLWFGEWVFHASLFLVLLRHLRFFLDPVPEWVWSVQTPGLIAGYVLPFSLVYILAMRLLSKREKYSARANMFLLGLVLAISLIGGVMQAWFKPDLAGVKAFVLGILCLDPAAVPESLLFITHFGLVLALIPFLPTHIVTAPFVMMEARKREQALRLVMHEK